jgi:hypothetical protein
MFWLRWKRLPGSSHALADLTGSARVVATRSVEVEHAEGIESDGQRA